MDKLRKCITSRIKIPPDALDDITSHFYGKVTLKGKYLVTIAHCQYCHTATKNGQEAA